MRYFISAALVVVAIIHLLPLVGVLGPARLVALYGVAVPEPNLELLLRHRAVLFGIIGALLLAATVHVPLRPAALLVGLASVVSFLLLAWLVGPINTHLFRVVVADILALVLLLAAGLVHLRLSSAA
jgi:hypothetical protein